MTDMMINGVKLDEPIRRQVHRHSWHWAREGSAECSCIEVVYPNPAGGERMFLHGSMGFNSSPNKDVSSGSFVMTDFIIAIANHYLNEGWTLAHFDASSAVLTRP